MSKLTQSLLSLAEGFALNVGATRFIELDPKQTALYLGLAAILSLRHLLPESDADTARERVAAKLGQFAESDGTLLKAIERLATDTAVAELVDRDRIARIIRAVRKEGTSTRQLIDESKGDRTRIEHWLEARRSENQQQFDDVIGEIQRGTSRLREDISDLKQTFADRQTKNEAALSSLLAISSREHIDPMFDRSKALINAGNLDAAEQVLDVIEKQYYTCLSGHQRFRLHAQRGQIAEASESESEAARHYLEAFNAEPNTFWSRGLRCIALKYMGEPDASTAIELLHDEFPDEPMAWFLWLREHAELRFDAVEAMLPAKVLKDADVLCHLAYRIGEEGDWSRAECLASQALDDAPGNPRIMRVLGEVKIEVEREHFNRCGHLSGQKASRLRQAIDLLTDVRKRMRMKEGAVSTARLYRAIGVAKELLNDQTAELEFRRAYQESPHDIPVLLDYVETVSNTNPVGLNEAIRLLSADSVRSRNNPHVAMVLAQYLMRRARKGDCETALKTLESIPLLEQTANDRIRLFVLNGILNLRLSGLEAAKVYCEQDTLDVPQCIRFSALAEVSRHAGALEEARSLASRAATEVSEETPAHVIHYVALELHRLADYKRAYRFWRVIVTPNSLIDDILRRLESAFNVGELADAVEFCEECRKEKILHPAILEIEMQILAKCHAINRMQQILENYLAEHPEGAYARQARLRIHELDLAVDPDRQISFDYSDLGPAEEVTLNTGLLMVSLLKRSTDPFGAVAYAYTLLRRYFHDESAHMGLFHALRLDPTSPQTPPTSDKVQKGFGFYFKPVGETELKFLIIEDETDPPPQPDRNEIATNDPLACRAIGKSVGDRFLFNPDGRRPMEVEITQIHHKTIMRFQDCIKEFNNRFRTSEAMVAYDVVNKATGEPDFRPIIEELNAKDKRVQDLEATATKERLPISMFADLMGSSVLRAAQHFVASPHLSITASVGTVLEGEMAAKTLTDAKSIVMSSSALSSIYLLGLHTHLTNLPYKLLVPWSAVLEFNREYDDAARHPVEGGYVSSRNGRISFQEFPKGHFEARAKSLADFRRWLAANAEAIDGVAIMQWPDQTTREVIQNVLPASIAEAMAISRSLSVPLWDDDLRIGELFGFPGMRVWTQAVLYDLVERRCSSEEVLHETTLKLNVFGYRFTRCSARTLLYALRKCAWQPTQPEVQYLLRDIRSGAASAASAALILVRTLLEVHRMSELSVAQRDATLVEFAKALAERPDRGLALGLSRDLFRAAFLDGYGFMFALGYRFMSAAKTGEPNNLTWLL